MTKEEAIKRLKEARNTIQPFRYVNEAIDYAIKALEQESVLDKQIIESLTDTEQTIFITAMLREEKVCEEVCTDNGVDLVSVCRSIERKVRKTLWR